MPFPKREFEVNKEDGEPCLPSKGNAVLLTFSRCHPIDTPSSSCPTRILYRAPTSSTL